MTEKQRLFCKEYMIDLNATQAAIRAGYSVDTAYAIGWENLRKPEIKEEISKLLAERHITKDGVVKLISDIARTDLNDYFKVRRVRREVPVEKSLREIAAEVAQKISFEEEFADRAQLEGDAYEAHLAAQQSRRMELTRLELELEHNPFATRVVYEEEWAEEADLDLPKLIRDKEAGKIKTYAVGQYGPKVEMYPADAALRDLARIHGLFEADNKQSATVINARWGKDTED